MRTILRISGITFVLLAWMIAFNTMSDVAQSQGQSGTITGKPAITTTLMQEQQQEEALDPELVAEGREIFELTAGGVGCASCHGPFAMGDVEIGPNLRGVTEETIRGALENVEVMEFLTTQVTDNDIKAVAAYLKYLSTLTPYKSVREKSVFDPIELKVTTKTEAQIIIQNKDRTACTFTIADVEMETIEIKGRKSGDIIWMTPETPGTFTGSCAEKPEELITIIVEEPQPESGGE